MPRKCSICAHPQHETIDRALAERQGYAALAREFGCSSDALERHRRHVPAAVVQAGRNAVAARADDVWGRILAIERHATRLAVKAERRGNLALAARLRTTELTRIVELLTKARGQIHADVNVLVAPQWIELRTVILQALDAHPAAKDAVVLAIDGRRIPG